jgi:hypothetical protein
VGQNLTVRFRINLIELEEFDGKGRSALRNRSSEAELQKLAQRLVKPDGEAWEEGELVDIRLDEDLKRR